MKRKLITIFIGLYFTNIFALTPHINKGKIEEISLSQGIKELQLSEKELKDINKEFFGILEFNNDFPPVMEVDFDSPVQIFKQTFDETNEIIYRVISETKESYPFAHGGFFQKGYYSNGTGKPNLIFADFYDATASVFDQRTTNVKYNYNFMPVIKSNRIAGIMIYGIEQFNQLRSIVEQEGADEILYHKAAVYWKNNFSTADLRKSYSNSADIYIECSKPLIDESDTFKYTIQNAFDKNPSTSYVEDTDDDLMFISFGSQKQLEKIALINGYALNKEYYQMNNRVKTIGCESINNKNYEIEIHNRFVIDDFNISYQIFEVNKKYYCIPSIIVEDIYKGDKYSDTCIAEIDYLFKKDGWLFGGIN